MNDYLRKRRTWHESEIISDLKKSLDNDLISLVEVDTTYGLLANITKKSYDALNNLKGRPPDKPYLILIAQREKITSFVDPLNLTSHLYAFLKKCWPGTVTLVFKVKPTLMSSPFLTSAHHTIALRCPDHIFLYRLLSSFEGLFSTSANISKEPMPKSLQEINKKLIEQTDLLISNNETELQSHDVPSTIIDVSSLLCVDKGHNTHHAHDCRVEGEIKVIREGAYPIELLEMYYGQKFKR